MKQLTDTQAKNLLIFLDRVQVKGIGEATALADIAITLKKEGEGNGDNTEPSK